MSGPGFKGVPLFDPDPKALARQITAVLNSILLGKTNNTKTVTLTANAASTTITDARIGVDTVLLLMPQTANAAAALATTYVSATGRVNGSVTISHANNAQTDKTFSVVLVG